MPQIIQPVAPYLIHYGYLAVFSAVMLEDLGVPVPGETMLISASALAALSGHLFIGWAGLAGCVGAVVGDNIGLP